LDEDKTPLGLLQDSSDVKQESYEHPMTLNAQAQEYVFFVNQ
jgi:hypothetical protein